MDNEEEQVELKAAYWWYCPNCAEENYERAVAIEGSPEEIEKMRESIENDMGIEVEMEFSSVPEVVVCKKCHKQYTIWYNF